MKTKLIDFINESYKVSKDDYNYFRSQILSEDDKYIT
jgi:hypothetical protein